MLKVGAGAPDFELPDQHGTRLTLDALLAGGDLVLYFYPIDFSPVCSAEACAFRDRYDGIRETGMQVVGVSPQDVATHARFAERFSLPFPLLSDPRSGFAYRPDRQDDQGGW